MSGMDAYLTSGTSCCGLRSFFSFSAKAVSFNFIFFAFLQLGLTTTVTIAASRTRPPAGEVRTSREDDEE